MIKFLYTVEKKCVICDKEHSVTKVRARLSMLKQDSDFCTYYKELNPYYYGIWVCPNCGFAVHEAYFEDVPTELERIKSFLAKRQVKVNFSGQRTRDQAIATYKLAIFFAEMMGVIASRLAGLYLKLAWLYREGEQQSEEMVVLDKAREYYELAFRKERMPIGNMTELTVEYLCGELLRRTGKVSEAMIYISKVKTSPQAKKEKRIARLATDAWEAIREQLKEQKELREQKEVGG